MYDELIIDPERNTSACGLSENHMAAQPTAEAFLALINHQIGRSSCSMSELADALQISRRQLGRILTGRRPLRIADLQALTNSLGIDRARATVAIEIIGDWRSYDDVGLNIMMQMLHPVVARLRDRSNFAIEPLTKPAQDRLCDWLADTIITNEEQIRRRREGFIKLPDL